MEGDVKLLAVDDARRAILEAAVPLAAETVALDAALLRTLAEPVTAARSQPPFAASAMDGWAVRAADCPGRLKIVGESAAMSKPSSSLSCATASRAW